MNLKVLWARERFGWMGHHSGYDQVCEAIAKLEPGNYQSVWRQRKKALAKPTRERALKLVHFIINSAQQQKHGYCGKVFSNDPI
jgi:hypothetical protein